MAALAVEVVVWRMGGVFLSVCAGGPKCQEEELSARGFVGGAVQAVGAGFGAFLAAAGAVAREVAELAYLCRGCVLSRQVGGGLSGLGVVGCVCGDCVSDADHAEAGYYEWDSFRDLAGAAQGDAGSNTGESDPKGLGRDEAFEG